VPGTQYRAQEMDDIGGESVTTAKQHAQEQEEKNDP
jgi:hypothetical protein